MICNFTQEDQLTDKLNSEINTFWQKGVFSSFEGVDDKRIEYAAFIHDEMAQCLVISPGRSESYLKYQELLYDLSQQHINVFIIDHRGQGLSERLLTNPEKGYVAHFDDYAEDLYTFINAIIPTLCKPKSTPLLLAHSMGGAIAIRLMQLYPNCVQSALLSSPMIAINTGALPIWIAKTLVHVGHYINQIMSDQAWYFLGQSNAKNKCFEDNELMHSRARYHVFTTLYHDKPELKLGGVTFGWLKQAIQTSNKIFEDLDKIESPLFILQAAKDTIVDNSVQNKFCLELANSNDFVTQNHKPITIDGAYHELFFESDQYRNQALDTVINWIKTFTQ